MNGTRASWPRANTFAIRTARSAAPTSTERLTFAPADLAPPATDISLPADNLLLFSTEGRDLTLTLPYPADSEPEQGDLLDLIIDDVIVPGSQVTLDGTANPITITLPAANHAVAGPHRINYQLTFIAGGNTELGPMDQVFKVDYDAPGADAAVPDFSFEVTEGLTPERLDANGDLPAHVYGYAGLDIDDRITVTIDGDANTSPLIVDHIPDDGNPIQVMYPKAMIDALDDAPHLFGYYVEDRAGNRSDPSDEVEMISLIKGFITPLDAPLIPEGDDGLVDDADTRLGGGATVQIPANARLDQKYTAVIHWGSATSAPFSIPAGTQDPVTSLVIPYGTVYDQWFATSAGADQRVTVNVSYEIFLNGIHAGLSAVKTVDVNLFLAGGGDPDPETPVHEALLAPTVKSSGGANDNVIPIEDFNLPGTMVIPFLTSATPGPAAAAFVAGDIITVQYGVATPFTHTVTPGDITAAVDIVFALAVATIQAAGTGTIPVTYTITHTLVGGGTNLSLSPVQLVTVSSSTDLPGGGATLAAARWSNSGGKTTVGPEEARTGVEIEIPGYTNKKEGDLITVSLIMGRGFNHVDGEAAITPPRTASKQHTVGAADAGPTQPSTVTFLYDELMYFQQSPLTMHAHIDYKVLGMGTAIEVGSDVLFVRIDCRGDEPT